MLHFNPDRPTEHRLYDMSREVGIEARTVELTNHANRISESDYFSLIRSLNKKQWEFFQHVVTWVKTKHEPFYTFLTGGAGCGKSVVVRTIFQALHRHLCSIEGEDPDDIKNSSLCSYWKGSLQYKWSDHSQCFPDTTK
ncbi:Hypothetical predicted protein [Mytilus galloprovincialis]|uniref:ATP-dependent DNA helicase n=1 Tax=Mytilus galloprovincialis TaxID=29158 RepID=A0A8B6FG98_MYTGA|nr:Hypothetical predicted protein [Mytilus galloprovincialis]